MQTPRTPYELDRNDTDGAVEVYRFVVMNSKTADELGDAVSILLQLQDDPEQLDHLLERVSNEPAMAEALRKLGAA